MLTMNRYLVAIGMSLSLFRHTVFLTTDFMHRDQGPAGVAMSFDGLERKPRRFRHPRHGEEDSAQADDGEDGEGEGETRSGQHQREGEDDDEVEAPVADRCRAHAKPPHPER